ncbi:TIGR00730 family Rossman fold protein [Marinoscillum sp. MHG1-6]|uniref:LOG family protein n=1 Tax=Marinoscillum sp. MHG1-6 TaxID=2959627 RepID=UPI00215845D7|nr:TIGR00730 family Rossman fold protein [Marinoscillum sp. MHG1-6]
MKEKKKRIAVFCGSRTGNHPEYEKATKELARQMVDSNIDLVYGGGKIGLMGILADEVMRLGGAVYGVIPVKILDMEVGHDGITELIVVETMHDRKAEMAKMSDGFVALPGGIGTMEEIIEVYTWQQLGYHNKPCGFFNVLGYFDAMISFLDEMVEKNFLSADIRDRIIVKDSAKYIVESFIQEM